MTKLPSWRQALPGFETLARCESRRVDVLKALTCDDGTSPLPAECTKANRCESGFCPVCIRKLRIRLLNFARRKRLHELEWFCATIRFDNWNIAPGDCSPFGKLRDHRLIKGVIRNLSRQPGPPLLVIGGIETVYVTIENKPVAKPFHVHLMISGRSEEQVMKAVGKRATRTVDNPFPCLLVTPGPTFADFLKAISYSFKQPFWKKSKRHDTDRGKSQFPKASELRELAGNYGVHGWNGRLVLCGVRMIKVRFELTVNLSSTSKPTATTIGSNSS